MRKVVSNSSPLIHLGKIGLLDLLPEQFGKILIPKAVWREVVEEGKKEQDVKFIIDAKWIKVQEVKPSPLLTTFLTLLDKGEAEAIALAIEIDADLVLLDESEARKTADIYNLRKTGLLGVLIKAKQQRKIKSLKYFLHELSMSGFYISRQLYDEILGFAGESSPA